MQAQTKGELFLAGLITIIFAGLLISSPAPIEETPDLIQLHIPVPPEEIVKPQINEYNNMTDTNLAPITTGWDMTYNTAPYIFFVDSTVLGPSGAITIRSEKHTAADVNYARECNSWWITAPAGSHVIFRAWVKTGAYTNNDHEDGARLGIDFYGDSHILDSQPHGYYQVDGVWYSRGDADYVGGDWDYTHFDTFEDVPISTFLLPWSNSEYTLLEWDVIVPSQYYTRAHTGETIDPEQIVGMICWLDCRDVGDDVMAWFADTEVYVNPTNKVATPTFSPAAGTYTEPQDITLYCSTSGAAVHYTTDGSTPDSGDTTYTDPIAVGYSNMLIKAIGVKAGLTDSDVASAYYVIQEDPPATYFEDDYETGDLSAYDRGPWSYGAGSSISVQNTVKLADDYSLKATLGDVASAYAIAGYTFTEPNAVMFVDVLVRFSALPGSGDKVAFIEIVSDDVSDTHTADVYLTSDGSNIMLGSQYHTTGGQVYANSGALDIEIDTTYEVTLKISQDVSNGEVAVWLDGVKVVDATGLANSDLDNVYVYFGAEHIAQSAALSVYLDNVAVDSQYNGPTPPSSGVMPQLAFQSLIANRRR